MPNFDEKDYWRSILLFGLNTATYKIALGQALIYFARNDKSVVTINELAEHFFDLYMERLKKGMPQLFLPNRMTVMERYVNEFNLGKIDRNEAIDKVAQNAFGDVIPRFHTVNNEKLPLSFYEFKENKMVLTDSVFKIFSEENSEQLENELLSRWDLLEAAFAIKRENIPLVNDIRKFYLEKGYSRKNITHMVPALSGYQNGICFYCSEVMSNNDIHVDHVIPRQLLNHDSVWNLVLAHSFCNEQKSDFLPPLSYVGKLIDRNEYLIHSNHPLKHELIKDIGVDSKTRKENILKIYEDAKTVIRYTWPGVRGYNPETDPFFKSFVRKFIAKQ